MQSFYIYICMYVCMYVCIHFFCNVFFSLSLPLPWFITVLTVPIFLYRLCYPLSCEIGICGSWDLNNITQLFYDGEMFFYHDIRKVLGQMTML